MTSPLRKKLLTTVRNELAHSELNYGELTQRGVGSVTDNRPVGRLRRKGKQHARLLPLLRRALCYAILTAAPANLLIQPTDAFAQESTVSAAELQNVPVNPFRDSATNRSGNISIRSFESDESPLRPRQFLGGNDSASNMRSMESTSGQGTTPGVALRWRTSSKVSTATAQGSLKPSTSNALRPSSRIPTTEAVPQSPSGNITSSGRRISTNGSLRNENTSQDTVVENNPWRAHGTSATTVNSPSNTLRSRENSRVVSASYQDPAIAAPEATINPPGTIQPPSSSPATGTAPPVLPTLPPDTAASGLPTTPGNANVPPLLDPFGDRAKTKQPSSAVPGSDPLASPEPAPAPTPGSLPAFPPTIPPANNPTVPGVITPPADASAPSDSVPPKELPNTTPPALMPSEPQDATPMPSEENTDVKAADEKNTGEKNADEMQESNSEEKQEISASDRDDVLSISPQKAPEGYSCDEIRARLKTDTLDKIELDVTPRFGRGSKAPEAMEQMRDEFIAAAPVRTWRDRSGRVLAQGKLKDWRRNRAILDVKGREVSFLVSDLSDTDAAYVADSWGVPHLCGLDQDDFKSRQFAPITMTWKASELMHKPLYFEEVALERYGHTAGPIWQPVISSGHFFANIAVMPYKMGIHPMTECQYALGYYRPGNCAPWQLPAVPLSGRGALYQAKVVTGSVFLLP